MLRRKITPAAPTRTDPRGGAIEPYAGGAAVAGTDGKTWESTQCYNCQGYGHTSRNCPASKKAKAAAAAAAKAKETDEPESTEESNGSSKGSGDGKKTTKPANSKPQPPVSPSAATASGRMSATGKFFTEEDDEYASEGSSKDGNAGACMSCAEGLVLFPKGMGDPARRA
jgi:hypothetical protein